MNEIDLSARLKQLEAEVDNEIQIQNDTRQKIWEEMTGHKAVTSVTDTFSVKLTDNLCQNAITRTTPSLHTALQTITG